jgi:hypothetical protein
MYGFVVVLVLALFSIGLCDECNNLDGFWYNQLGAEIFLKHSSDGKLIGEYRSAAELYENLDGKTHSVILGESICSKNTNRNTDIYISKSSG